MRRAERLVASAWRLARTDHVQTEAVLEEALAAVLEEPEVWSRFVAHLDWTGLPTTPPHVTTQDWVQGGRTDIQLSWSGGYRLVLELKVAAPPTAEQVRVYLDSGADVAAVAAFTGVVDVEVPAGRRFLGVVTWARILELDWDGAPLVLRQLHALIRALEVVVPHLSLASLEGLVSAWDAWTVVENHVLAAAQVVGKALTAAGLPCVVKDEPRHHVRVDDRRAHRRFVGWTWPSPWRKDSQYGFYAGLVLGRPGMPLRVDGVPDIVLGLHVNPESSFGHVLREDAALRKAVKEWLALAASENVCREHQPDGSTWDLLRARSSSLELLYAADQGAQLSAWMEARAKEWATSGIVARLAELEPQRGAASDPVGPSPGDEA